MNIESGKGGMLKKGKNLKYVFIEENKEEKMDNFFFSCRDLIGKPFGTAFKVLNKKSLEVIDSIQVEEHRTEYEKLGKCVHGLLYCNIMFRLTKDFTLDYIYRWWIL